MLPDIMSEPNSSSVQVCSRFGDLTQLLDSRVQVDLDHLPTSIRETELDARRRLALVDLGLGVRNFPLAILLLLDGDAVVSCRRSGDVGNDVSKTVATTFKGCRHALGRCKVLSPALVDDDLEGLTEAHTEQ